MRILLLPMHYHPVINPNVFRWSAIAEHWVQQGHEVHVLCARFGKEPDESSINGVKVHRIGHASLLDVAYNLLNTQQRRGAAGGEKPGKKSSARQLIEKIINITWRKIYWPDGSCVWYFAGKKKALQLQQQFDFEAIVSISPPYTPHLVAAAVKRRFPKVRWLMDIEDPFSFSEAVFINNRTLYQQYNYKKEGQLLTLADAVSVTVQKARELYIKYFSNIINKIKVVPPLYSLASFEETFSKDVNVIHVGYFGAFYDPIRTPDYLLELFYQLQEEYPDFNKKLILHFFGEITPVFQSIFEYYTSLLPNVKIHGLVTRERAAAAMNTMDFLINIGNTTDYHLPSKCVDYLMSGKPIINLSYCKNDPFTDFMKNYPFILHLDVSGGLHPTMLNEFINFINKYNGREVASKDLEAMIQPYTIDVIGKQYFNLLQNIAE